jgi:hypothetical protein
MVVMEDFPVVVVVLVLLVLSLVPVVMALPVFIGGKYSLKFG